MIRRSRLSFGAVAFAIVLPCASLVGCGSRGGGDSTEPRGPGILKQDLDLVTQQNLKSLGLAYKQMVELDNRAPSNFKDLGPDLQQKIKSSRDGEPFEVVWGFKRLDPIIPPNKSNRVLLAWEKKGDANGNRFVLFTDFSTVELMRADEFKTALKAKPNR